MFHVDLVLNVRSVTCGHFDHDSFWGQNSNHAAVPMFFGFAFFFFYHDNLCIHVPVLSQM